MFKLEGPYIYDWVRYHLALGFEHVYLYDNSSPDNSAEEARRAGGDRVSIEPCPGHPVQETAHLRCLRAHQTDCRWIAFLDIDEYLVTHAPLVETLQAYEEYPALCPHWVLFGSNGLDDFDARPVPLRFTRSQADVNQHVKSIVDPVRTRTDHWVTAHRFFHSGAPVDENRKPIAEFDSIPPNPTGNILYVAHYVTKSKAECWERRSRPRPDTGEYRYNVPEFFAAHDRNEKENLDVVNAWTRFGL